MDSLPAYLDALIDWLSAEGFRITVRLARPAFGDRLIVLDRG